MFLCHLIKAATFILIVLSIGFAACGTALAQNTDSQEKSISQFAYSNIISQDNLIAENKNTGGRIGGGNFPSESKKTKTDQDKQPKRSLFPITFKVASPEFNILRDLTLIRVNFYLEEQAQNELDRANYDNEEYQIYSALQDYREGIIKVRQDNIF
ncbi:hypothetical protein [Nodosilinea nodulosa]|uniref:hypothetical protein n=1 Tax=Nodosilinea nodulosa TaxID=416001 RepID=UPI000369CB5E|nr:hypothetical protein [Nodosilinea nodulosa]